ncbi:hypothetical protein ZOSMA_467G00040 [Zostera marina]|uniref:Uncharacterized protein n=1 Tax=Zostera marina TaxID=29655 RepID=A0A0K9P2C8_ZOSMR|nr:hypothetical protein ZOSMA_467G00040 [Zostera marina]
MAAERKNKVYTVQMVDTLSPGNVEKVILRLASLVYVVGGRDLNNEQLNNCEVYDQTSDVPCQPTIPDKRNRGDYQGASSCF